MNFYLNNMYVIICCTMIFSSTIFHGSQPNIDKLTAFLHPVAAQALRNKLALKPPRTSSETSQLSLETPNNSTPSTPTSLSSAETAHPNTPITNNCTKSSRSFTELSLSKKTPSPKMLQKSASFSNDQLSLRIIERPILQRNSNPPRSLDNLFCQELAESLKSPQSLKVFSEKELKKTNLDPILRATNTQLHDIQSTLKKRSDDIFMKSYATKTVALAITGATMLHVTTTQAPSQRMFIIDDIVGTSLAKVLIQPLCCAALGGLTWYTLDGWLFGSIQEQIKVQQKELNGLKIQLTNINSSVSSLKTNHQQESDKIQEAHLKLHQILDQVKAIKKSAENDYRESLETELDNFIIPAEAISALVTANETTAQKIFSKKNKSYNYFALIAKTLNIHYKK